MAFMMMRANVGDYDAWKARFDEDPPKARSSALGYRIFRGIENPSEVFVQVEFDSTEDAAAARARLVGSGVLEQFPDRTGPTLVEQAEAVTR